MTKIPINSIDRLTVKSINLNSKNNPSNITIDKNEDIKFSSIKEEQSSSFLIDLKSENEVKLKLQTKNKIIGIKTDNSGNIIFGNIDGSGVQNAFSIDTVNNKIKTSRIQFSDGTYLDTAAGLRNNNILSIKANKLFFKYDSNGIPMPDQTIEITIERDTSISSGPLSFSFSPNPSNDIELSSSGNNIWNLNLSEFQKANSDTLLITATADAYTDSVSIFKARDGINAIVGGLTNPTLTIPVETNGTIDGLKLASLLAGAGGTYVVYKAGEEITGDTSKVDYSVETSTLTEGLSISIADTGIYTINSFDIVNEERGKAVLIATDKITGQQFKTAFYVTTIKRGETGATGASGNNAKVVSISVDDAQIAYSASDGTPSPTKIQVTASQQNHNGTVYYEFKVYEAGSDNSITLVNSTSNTLLLDNAQRDYGSGVSYLFINGTRTDYKKSKTLKVITREGSPTSTPIAEDIVTIIATKDGSDALEVVFPNNNHSFVANSAGVVSDYTGGGSIVEAYIGNEQLVPSLGTELTNGKFKISVDAVTNIVPGAITIDPDSNKKRFIIGDPTSMSASNTADITYLIQGKDSKGLQKSQIVKASFSKSKAGVNGANGINGSNGVNARAVELISDVYQIPYNASNISPVTSLVLTATPKNTAAGATLTYKFYKDDVLLDGGEVNTNTKTINSDLPIAGSSSTYKVELYENGSKVGVDSVPVFGTKDGGDGVTVSCPNSNHTFTCDVDGNPQTYDGSGTTIRVFVGSDALTAVEENATLDNGQFKVSRNLTTGNITIGTVTVNGTVATVGNMGNFTTDNATVTYTISFKRPTGGEPETYNQIASYSKSKQGTQGTEGSNAKFVSVSPEIGTFAFSDINDFSADPCYIPIRIKQQNLASPVTLSSITISNENGTISYNPVKFVSQNVTNGTGETIFHLLYDSFGININYADWSGWTVGTGNALGSYGTDFFMNGTAAENSRIIDVTPHGSRGIIWTVPSNEATNGAVEDTDGGWDKFITTGINSSKKYRSVVWVKRNSVATNGNFYHGCDGNNTLNLDGTQNTNPYFYANNIGITLPIKDRWYLSVGFIKANSDGSTASDGGLYDSITGQKIINYTDYKMAPGATTQTHRTYLYYDTSGLSSLSWWAPRFEEVNGSEPTIEELLYGFKKPKNNLPIKITVNHDNVIDAEKIYKIDGGTDSATVAMSNEAHIFQASSTGVVSSYDGSGTDLKVYIGATELTASTSTSEPTSNNTFTVTSRTITPSNFVTLPGSDRSVVGNILRFAPVTSVDQTADSGYITYTIKARDASGVIRTFTKEQTYVKAKAGINGAPGISGSNGVNARAVDLISDRYQIPYNASNNTSVGSFKLTATARNTAAGATLTYKFYKDDVLLDGGEVNTNTKTINSDLPIAGSSSTYKVELYENGTLVSFDAVPIFGTKDGGDGVTIVCPNLNHTFTCDVDGNPQSYVGSGTTIEVAVGSTPLVAVSSDVTDANLQNGQFKVNGSVTAGTISVGAITAGGNTVTVGNMNNFTTDTATVTYRIAFKRPTGGTTEIYNQIASYSKSKQGTQGLGIPGIQGPEGPEGLNPEDIGFFSSIYIKDNIKYPWGWGRVQNVNSDLQTVLNNNTESPIEEKLVYDPDLANSIQPNSLSKKGGYAFYPQNDLSLDTNIFCYSRPIPIDKDYLAKLKFIIAKQNTNVGIGRIIIGVYFLNSSLQKLTDKSGKIFRWTSSEGNSGIQESGLTIGTSTTTLIFHLKHKSNTGNVFLANEINSGPTIRNGNSYYQDSNYGNSMIIPSNAAYAVPFIHISNVSTSNSPILLTRARWWTFNPVQSHGNGKLYVGTQDVEDMSSLPTTALHVASINSFDGAGDAFSANTINTTTIKNTEGIDTNTLKSNSVDTNVNICKTFYIDDSSGTESYKITNHKIQTTDATVTTIYTLIPGSTDTGYFLEADIIGRSTGATPQINIYRIIRRIKNDFGAASSVSFVSLGSPVNSEENPNWSVDASTAGGGFKITVTGEANTTINWSAIVKLLSI
jgi:hypothetical protein